MFFSSPLLLYRCLPSFWSLFRTWSFFSPDDMVNYWYRLLSLYFADLESRGSPLTALAKAESLIELTKFILLLLFWLKYTEIRCFCVYAQELFSQFERKEHQCHVRWSYKYEGILSSLCLQYKQSTSFSLNCLTTTSYYSFELSILSRSHVLAPK